MASISRSAAMRSSSRGDSRSPFSIAIKDSISCLSSTDGGPILPASGNPSPMRHGQSTFGCHSACFKYVPIGWGIITCSARRTLFSDTALSLVDLTNPDIESGLLARKAKRCVRRSSRQHDTPYRAKLMPSLKKMSFDPSSINSSSERVRRQASGPSEMEVLLSQSLIPEKAKIVDSVSVFVSIICSKVFNRSLTASSEVPPPFLPSRNRHHVDIKAGVCDKSARQISRSGIMR